MRGVDNMLEVKNISKKIKGKNVIDNVSMSAQPGEITVLIGENGAGKTTMFRLILQLLIPDKGQITFSNEDVREIGNVGYLPEEHGLYPALEVEEQLVYLGRLKGLSKLEAKEEIDNLLNEIGAEKYRHAKLNSLSKGNQQKVQIVNALLGNPYLLILDEVFSGLDPLNVENIKKILIREKQKGKTLIISSHMLNHIQVIADKVYLLKKGRIYNVTKELISNQFESHLIFTHNHKES